MSSASGGPHGRLVGIVRLSVGATAMALAGAAVVSGLSAAVVGVYTDVDADARARARAPDAR